MGLMNMFLPKDPAQIKMMLEAAGVDINKEIEIQTSTNGGGGAVRISVDDLLSGFIRMVEGGLNEVGIESTDKQGELYLEVIHGESK